MGVSDLTLMTCLQCGRQTQVNLLRQNRRPRGTYAGSSDEAELDRFVTEAADDLADEVELRTAAGNAASYDDDRVVAALAVVFDLPMRDYLEFRRRLNGIFGG